MLSRVSITRIVNLRLKKNFSGMSIKIFFDQYVSCRAQSSDGKPTYF